MQVGETRLLFSGDLGPDHKAFHADPEGPAGLDHVICDNPYGDRAREDLKNEQPPTLPGAEIKAAFKHRGNIVIPAFALDRKNRMHNNIGMIINNSIMATHWV